MYEPGQEARLERAEMEFEKGSILRKEMLQDLYEYPRNILESFYALYGDGILFGLNWKMDGKEHIISPGALKLQGKIYVNKKPIYVEKEFAPQLRTSNKYGVFFVEDKAISEPSRKISFLKLELLQDKEAEEIRTGDRKYYYYCYVRYDDSDGFQVINDVKYSYGLWAGYSKRSKCSYRLPLIGLEKTILPILEEKKNRNSFDYEILKSIYDGRSISTDLVILYIKDAGIWLKDADLENPMKLMEKLADAAAKSGTQSSYMSEKEETEREKGKFTINQYGML